MCTSFICLMSLSTALILAKPVSCEEVEEPGVPALCPLVRSAADQTALEAQASVRLQEAEKLFPQEFDTQSAIPSEAPSSAGTPALRADRILFESFLVNWLFFEDLAPDQRTIMQKFFLAVALRQTGCPWPLPFSGSLILLYAPLSLESLTQ